MDQGFGTQGRAGLEGPAQSIHRRCSPPMGSSGPGFSEDDIKSHASNHPRGRCRMRGLRPRCKRVSAAPRRCCSVIGRPHGQLSIQPPLGGGELHERNQGHKWHLPRAHRCFHRRVFHAMECACLERNQKERGVNGPCLWWWDPSTRREGSRFIVVGDPSFWIGIHS